MGVAVQEFFARFSPPSRAARAIGASMLCVCLSAGRSAAQVPLASADVRLQSEGAGGGTLAVRLTYPASVTNYRYPDGAPVAVYLAGGFTPGGLGGSPRIPQQGFVLVTFIYPGGSEGATASDGIYDYRGDNCQKALRDMIRFAGGVATDTLGRLIDDVVPGPVHPGLVGLAPFSNGLIGLITLDRYGAEIPFTPYHVGWENPTSGQIVAVELGGIRDDCDPATDSDGNGIPGDDGRNPWYDPATGYGPSSFAVDFGVLAFDPLFPGRYTDPTGRCAAVNQAGAVFHDGRTNGRVDFMPGAFGCLDYDGDGTIEASEDYKLGGIATFTAACGIEIFHSRETTRALSERNVFPGVWPSWIATVEESGAFWDLRDATAHWDGIASRFPRLKAMTVFSRKDHVQSQSDHPHVRQAMDGIRSHGLWYRLNADAAYFAAVNGSLPAGYVETAANADVPPGEMSAHGEPSGTASDDMSASGLAEMADRLHAGCWWADLDGTMPAASLVAPEAGDIALGSDRSGISWTAADGAYCYDVLRGDLTALADDGARVVLGGGSCIEEDSADTVAADETFPGPGQGFFYVVKPNGLHGGYGVSSAGRPRVDVFGACVP